ncbi:MAG: rhomboid family intramembrane serine protease [Granulosicoccus sp.]
MPSLPRGCPVTLTLIAINVVMFIGQFTTQDMLTNLGLLYGPSVEAGQYWRIITSGFLHGSILHIGFNMYLLYMLGPQLEQAFGSLRFILMYFGSMFGGVLAVLMFGFTQPTLGASGAVLGLAGGMFIALWGRGVSPKQSPVFGMVVLNLALPLLVPGISFWGHFGGVVAGAAMAFVLVWLPDKNHTPRSANSLSQGAALFVVMAAACFIVPGFIG